MSVTKNWYPVLRTQSHCLISEKIYIYKKRCQEEILNFESVKNIVKDYHNSEKYIFTTNGILHNFDRKWNLYKNLFKKNTKKLQQYRIGVNITLLAYTD